MSGFYDLGLHWFNHSVSKLVVTLAFLYGEDFRGLTRFLFLPSSKNMSVFTLFFLHHNSDINNLHEKIKTPPSRWGRGLILSY